MTELVLEQTIGHVRLLTWNRPHRLNAITPELHTAYNDALDAAAGDPRVRAVVVTGHGQRGFSSGGDLASLLEMVARGHDGVEHDPRGHLHALTVPKPVIAAVNGGCFGLGLLHALACDLRIAGDRASFSTTFPLRGLVAEQGMSWLLPHAVGRGVAMEMLLTGCTIDAAEAHRVHLVNRVVPHEGLVEWTVRYAEEMTRVTSPTAMSVIKSQVTDHPVLALQDAVAAADLQTQRALAGPDFAEGIASFVEKRDAVYPTLPLPTSSG